MLLLYLVNYLINYLYFYYYIYLYILIILLICIATATAGCRLEAGLELELLPWTADVLLLSAEQSLLDRTARRAQPPGDTRMHTF